MANRTLDMNRIQNIQIRVVALLNITKREKLKKPVIINNVFIYFPKLHR